MHSAGKHVMVAVALAALGVMACSSDDPAPASGNADGGGAGGGGGACVTEDGAVPSDAVDPSVTCCTGLFKYCIGTCTCSKVKCGTEAEQPPPGVPCCYDPAAPQSTKCTTPVGGVMTCTCGNRDAG